MPSFLVVYFPPENVNSVKSGTLLDPYTRMWQHNDRGNHRILGENKYRGPRDEALIEMATESSLKEKVGKREKDCVLCAALFSSFFFQAWITKPSLYPYPGVIYVQDTNINIGDHFLLVCLYLCPEGEIYLFQALTKAWFQALMKCYSFLHE